MTDQAGPDPDTAPGAPATDATLDADGLPTDRPRTVGRRILSGLFSYGVVIFAVWYLLTHLQTGDSAPTPSRSSPCHLIVSVALGLVNLVTTGHPSSSPSPD